MRCLVLSLFACALLAGRAAAAGEPPPGEGPAAALLVKGNTAFKEGRFADAEEAYREAFAIRSGYDIAGNLGVAELIQGKHREAAKHLAFTLRLFPITGDPAVRERMSRAFEKARREVGAVRVTTSVNGASILVDGALTGASPLDDEVFVDPGEHVFEAKLEGWKGVREGVTVEKGGSAAVTLSLRPIVAERIRVVHDTPIPKRRSLVPGAVISAGGVAAIGAGVALLSAASAQMSDAEALRQAILKGRGSCVAGAGNYDGRCPDLQGKLRSYDSLRGAGFGVLTVGSLAAASGVAYLLWPERRAGAAPSRLRILPVFGRGEGAAMVTGAF